MRNILRKNAALEIEFKSECVTICYMAVIILLVLTGCGLNTKVERKYPYGPVNFINYDDLENWASHPFIKDMSDSLSHAYDGEINEDLCDVFFLYPTSFTDAEWRNVSNASLLDKEINMKTDNTSILYQASIFNGIGRIYAPRYRQAHINRYFDNGPTQKPAFELAYQDVKNAFEKYLRDWNEQRPIIIAAHSQGTTHAIRLVKEMVDRHDLGNRIVYMYLLGMPVKKDEFQEVKMCQNDSSSHCLFSWRTYRKGYQDNYTSKSRRSIAVTNPVSISDTSGWSKRSIKKKAILWKYNIAYEKTHDTRIMGDMLWITQPRFKGGIVGLFLKNYHAGDFNLFYGDIRSDIKRRLSSVKYLIN